MSGNFLDPSGSLQRNMDALIERGRQVAPFLSNNRTPSLYFPENYMKIDHFVTFRVLKFNSVTRTSTLNSDLPLVGGRISSVARTLQTISLPMPAQLQTSYGADYKDDSMSALTEVLATGASSIKGDDIETTSRDLASGIKNTLNSASNQSAGASVASTITTLQTQMAQLMQNRDAQVAGGAVVGAGAADAAGSLLNDALAANLTGVARNSHKVLLFQGVNRREHRFSFSLSPRNRREAESIQKIIEAFKYHMLPSYGLGNLPKAASGLAEGFGVSPELVSQISGLASDAGAASRAFFEYPDVFEIEFNNRRQLFTIGESVLENMTVDYHPMNYPAYVRSLETPNVASPAEIVISLTFKETDIMTKEQIKQNRR